VHCAVDGQEGVALAQVALPDLILLDIDLPVMDGWEAIRILKTISTTREIPVIALTAHAMTSDRARVFAAGFDEYGTKPVEFEALMNKIQTLLIAREC
jgi:CheY-like chemotaxis protein